MGGRHNNSNCIFLDGDGSNSNWQQWKETVTAMGNRDKQQAMAATAAAMEAEAMMAGRAATMTAATEVTAATAAMTSMQERHQRSKGIDISNGGIGSNGNLTEATAGIAAMAA